MGLFHQRRAISLISASVTVSISSEVPTVTRSQAFVLGEENWRTRIPSYFSARRTRCASSSSAFTNRKFVALGSTVIPAAFSA